MDYFTSCAFLDKLEAALIQVPKVGHSEVLKDFPLLDVPTVVNVTQSEEETVHAAVFNIERGAKLEEILIYLKKHPLLSKANLILANELDLGMKRTENRDISAIIAKELGMNYVYGIEYVSVLAGREGNREGLHGNTIFSNFKLENPKIIRLPLVYDWFFSKEKRIGTRNAVLATTELGGKKVGIVSAHLENRSTPDKRLEQFIYLLDEIDAYFGDIPVILGGDMNTNAVDGDSDQAMLALAADKVDQQRRINAILDLEPLILYAETRGYSFRWENILCKSTRRKHMADFDDINLNLDWFFSKGFTSANPAVITAVFDASTLTDGAAYMDKNGRELSDHDAIYADFKLKE